MFEKRFMEFATQNTDNGEINNGFHDIETGEWYYTKDSENAKKICELLNELHEENQRLQHFESLYRERNLKLEKENKELRSDRDYWKTLSQSLARTNGNIELKDEHIGWKRVDVE